MINSRSTLAMIIYIVIFFTNNNLLAKVESTVCLKIEDAAKMLDYSWNFCLKALGDNPTVLVNNRVK